MCGRYSQSHSLKALEAAFDAIASADFSTGFSTSYNIAPGGPVAVVRRSEGQVSAGGGARELAGLHWGLIPGWMKERPKSAGMINARAETVASKPSFRAAFKRRRCLIPADSFYEWKKTAEGKQPWRFYFRNQPQFAFAGLWEHWRNGDEQIESCTIITTAANADMLPIHERMPVILGEQDYALWLGEQGAGGTTALDDLMQPPGNGLLHSHAVSAYVNKPQHDDARCIEALA